MKKFFLIAAAAAMVLSSCSKNTVSEDTSAGNAIGFGTYSGTATKSSSTLIADGTSLTKGTSFGVFGYLTVSSNWDATTSKPGFMPNQEVNYKADGTYEYTPVRYWPKDETKNKISFYGYYPFSESGSNGITVPTFTSETGMGSFGFKVKDISTDQVDFMVSKLEQNLTYSNAKTQTVSSENGRVKLTFHHMLTKIAVKVKTNADVNTQVTVNSITFTNVCNTGTLKPVYNQEAPQNEWWTLNTDATNYKTYSVVLDGTKQILTNNTTDYVDISAANHGGDLLLIPQTLGTNSKIVVNYTYQGKKAGALVGEPITEDISASLSSVTWGMNQFITYQLLIDFADRAIKFEAVVKPWTESTVTPVLVP